MIGVGAADLGCLLFVPLFQGGQSVSGDDIGQRDKVVDKIVGVVSIAVPDTTRQQQVHDVLELGTAQDADLVLAHERQRNAHNRFGGALGKDDIVDSKQHGQGARHGVKRQEPLRNIGMIDA